MIIEIIREKLLGIQVCSDVTPKELKKKKGREEFNREVNIRHPCGTINGWVLSDNKEHKPGKCEDKRGRWHYVFIC